MGPETINRLKDSEIHGDFVGRDKITNIIMFQESEREFVVTHNANIKSVSYFTGRETELQELRQRIEAGRKSVLVSGMGGIGKTHICRKLFEEYLNKHAGNENEPFRHLGYIEYDGDIGSSLQKCLKFKQQDSSEKYQEAAWRELEYLAADGKLLLFVDNVNKPIRADLGLQRLKGIPGAIVLTSRRVSLSDEFEPYRIGFLDIEQCIEIYEKIRFEVSGRKIDPGEVEDLEYIMEDLAGRHTITVELLAHLARTKLWEVKRLRGELDQKGFRLEFHRDGELVNIQESYEKLYDLSELTEAEQNILEAFSVFPYIPLAAETCNEWLLADAGVSEDDDILMGLYQKGWLQFDLEQESYALHPVFAQFVYERCKPAMEKHAGLIEACQECLRIPKSGSLLKCWQYISYAENILEKLDMEKKQHVLLMDQIAYVMWCMGEYKKAIDKYKIICGLVEHNGYYMIHYQGNIARMHVNLMEYEKAEKIYEKMLETYKMHSSMRLKIMGDLAYVYSLHEGKYEDAERLYETILNIKKIEKDIPAIAVLCNNIGYTCLRQKKYRKAIVYLKKNIEICEKRGLHYSLDLAGAYSILAGIYAEQEKYEKAEELYKICLMKYGEIEKNSIDYNDCFNLAYVYMCRGKYEEAEELYVETLKECIKIYGEDHLICARGYDGLAMLYGKAEKYELAVRYNLKTYKIQKEKEFNGSMRDVYGEMKKTYYKWNPQGNFNQWLEEQMKELEKK